MPRMSAAIQPAAHTASEAPDTAASLRTSHSCLKKGHGSNGKSVHRDVNLTRHASFELSHINIGDGASCRVSYGASCTVSYGELGPAPRSTTRRAKGGASEIDAPSIVQVRKSVPLHITSSAQNRQLKRNESKPQVVQLQEMQKSSGSRYFAELVRRRQMQIAADSAAAKTDGTRPSSWPTSSAESRASPRDMQPRVTILRSSIMISSPHSSAALHTSTTERHGTTESLQSSPGRLQKSSGGSRYCNELVRRRETKQKNNSTSAATTDISMPLMVTECVVIACIFGIFVFGLMTVTVSVIGLELISVKNMFAPYFLRAVRLATDLSEQ